MQELIGKTLDGTYRIDRLLGQGGMGIVYQAHDTTLDCDVAVKVLHAHYADDVDLRARFYQETRLSATLDHPGIVPVHVYHRDMETGSLYLVMEFIPGQSLRTWLGHLAKMGQTVDLAETLAVAQQIAEALHYAHLEGVLHCDVKPSNILFRHADPALRQTGDLSFRPVLTDLGLARLDQRNGLTQAGTSMGTPAYMSPEQCQGREPGPGTDVYSLGVVLYEMLTGRVPFQVGSFDEAARRHSLERPPPLRTIDPDFPDEVEGIVLRALAKRPEDRFASAGDMADALGVALSHVALDVAAGPEPLPGTQRSTSLMALLAEASTVLGGAEPGIGDTGTSTG
jgi:serine/threonine protein kinase